MHIPNGETENACQINARLSDDIQTGARPHQDRAARPSRLGAGRIARGGCSRPCVASFLGRRRKRRASRSAWEGAECCCSALSFQPAARESLAHCFHTKCPEPFIAILARKETTASRRPRARSFQGRPHRACRHLAAEPSGLTPAGSLRGT